MLINLLFVKVSLKKSHLVGQHWSSQSKHPIFNTFSVFSFNSLFKQKFHCFHWCPLTLKKPRHSYYFTWDIRLCRKQHMLCQNAPSLSGVVFRIRHADVLKMASFVREHFSTALEASHLSPNPVTAGVSLLSSTRATVSNLLVWS